jgi:hypothetical protein
MRQPCSVRRKTSENRPPTSFSDVKSRSQRPRASDDVVGEREDFELREREVSHLLAFGLVALQVAREHRVETARVRSAEKNVRSGDCR